MKEILNEAQIKKLVTELASQVSFDYKDKKLVVVGVLDTSLVLTADFARPLPIPAIVGFIQVTDGAPGTPTINGLTVDVKDKDVLLVDTVTDFGLTMQAVSGYLRKAGARVRTLTLVVKNSWLPDYFGARSSGYLVGYGLTHEGKYWNLPGINRLEEVKKEDTSGCRTT